MKEINFYCVEEEPNLFIFSFIKNLFENKKKVIIYSDDKDKIEKLDNFLWVQKKTSFLPHLIQGENLDSITPILISNIKENKNNADFLLISKFNNDEYFLSTFKKIFYMYCPINPTLNNIARNDWNKYKELGYNSKLLKKNSIGKWEEYTDFIN